MEMENCFLMICKKTWIFLVEEIYYLFMILF